MGKSSKGINRRILTCLKDKCESPIMAEFLLELVREEISRPNGLRREDYRRRIDEWARKKEVVSNED